MLYFKHRDLVEKYHVSLKTVHNWIDAAKQGKVALRLHTMKSRIYVANTPENLVVLGQLSEKGKKYRNTVHHRTIQPRPEFYEIYTQRQILDIITNLNVHREIPRQYNYFKDGALNWDNWLKRLANEESPNILKGTVHLIRANLAVIDQLLEGSKKVNIIDLGVGNAYPIKELLGHLLERGILHRYIAIDISPSMLAVAENNIKAWYGTRINFEGHVRDISFEHFDDLLVGDMLTNDADDTINLVLLLGATPTNFSSFGDALKVIYRSMSQNDLLVYTDKPDTEVSRRYFDFSPASGPGKLSPNHQYILDLLNIDESLYDAEMGFDRDYSMRYVRVRLNSSITIKFKFSSGERNIDLEKGDTILLLRVWHMTALEVIAEFEKVGLMLLQSSLTKDRQCLLTISGIDTNPELE